MLRTPKLPIVAHRDAEEDGALGQRKEFDASTRACTDVAAPPTSQMKGCVEIMYRLLRAAGEENLYHESEDSAKNDGLENGLCEPRLSSLCPNAKSQQSQRGRSGSWDLGGAPRSLTVKDGGVAD